MPGRIHGHTRVQLAHGVSVIQRGPNMLQFGLDATRTGVIETPVAAELRPLLDGCRTPTRVAKLDEALQAHIDAEAARSLVADLLSYRILVPADRPQVAMLGTSAVAKATAGILEDGGVTVRSPLRRESDMAFLAGMHQWVPLAVVDTLSRAQQAAFVVKQRTGPVLPVSAVDARVFVGPLHLGVGDACLNCLHLHLIDRDAGWEHAVATVPGGNLRPDPVVVAAGATVAATQLRRLAGVPDPPGVSAPPPVAGQVTVVDPFAPQPIAAIAVAQHPRCRVCFA